MSPVFNFAPPEIASQKMCEGDLKGEVINKIITASFLQKAEVGIIKGKDYISEFDQIMNNIDNIIVNPRYGEAVQTKAEVLKARWLLSGHNAESDREKGIQILDRLAKLSRDEALLWRAYYAQKQGDDALAESLLLKAASQGRALAHLRLAAHYLHYQTDDSEAENIAKAKKHYDIGERLYLSKLAQGRCETLRHIADALLSDLYGGPYEELAVKWLEAAVKVRDAEAMVRLAKLYRKGQQLELNNERADILLGMAANLGDSEAMYLWGQRLIDKAENGASKQSALRWLTNAAKEGIRAARTLLIKQQLKMGREEEALVWLRQEVQEAVPLGEMLHSYGKLIEMGVERKEPPSQALKYYKLAADAGNREALVMIGDYYQAGSDASLPSIKALRYYRLAAQTGDEKAMMRLYEWYQCEGKEDAENYSNAEKWRILAEHFQAWGLQKERLTKQMSEGGIHSVAYELSDAMRRRAEGGDRQAMAYLSILLQHEPHLARKWQESAVREGKGLQKGLLAMAELLIDYPHYASVDDPLNLAQEYLQQAAGMGDGKAAYRLAQLHENYPQLQEGESKASKIIELLTLAVESNYGPARYHLAKWYKNSGEEQKATQIMKQAASKGDVRALIAQVKMAQENMRVQQAAKILVRLKKARICDAAKQEELAELQVKQRALEKLPVNVAQLKERAGKGDAAFMQMLGNAYAAGIGVPVSMKEAEYWWQKAAAN